MLTEEDEPYIVPITEDYPKGRNYQIDSFKIRGYIIFKSKLMCGVAMFVYASLEHYTVP